MASCQTSQWVNTAPYVKLTVTEKSSSGGNLTLQWTLQYVASSAANTSVNKSYSVSIDGSVVKSGTFNIDGKTGTHTIASGTKTINKTHAARSISFSCSFAFNLTWSSVYKGTLNASGAISIPAKTSYTVSYNANGGIDAPGNQTKWFGEVLKLQSGSPTRTGYKFMGWATDAYSKTAVFAPGANYTYNNNAVLYAVWVAATYAIEYNANGGIGAPTKQSKQHDTPLQLSSVTPSRENYTFAGWARSATSTTATYRPGAIYIDNAPMILYAVWVLTYTKPRITNIKRRRCDLTEGVLDYIAIDNDYGENVELSFDVEADFAYTTIEVLCKDASVRGWDSAITPTESSSGIAGNRTSYTAYFTNLSAETSYTLRITVRDTGGETVVIYDIPAPFFSIDFKPPTETSKGGAAIAKPAELDGVFDVGFETLLRGGIRPLALEPNTDLNDVQTPNTYIGANISNNAYANCPLASGTFTLSVEAAGEDGQTKQILTRCSKSEPMRYVRFYYQSAWGEWMHDSVNVEYDLTTGSDLNNYKQSGIWYFNSSHTPVNLPSSCVNGWLVVLRADSGAIKQFWLRYGSLDTNDYNCYVRTGNATNWSAWRRIASDPVVLYTNASGTNGTVDLDTLVDIWDLSDFEYIEVFYADNNGKRGGSDRIYMPDGKKFTLSIIEPSAASTTIIRRTEYTVNGCELIPNTTTAGYVSINASTASHVGAGTNYIKIIRVVGYYR